MPMPTFQDLAEQRHFVQRSDYRSEQMQGLATLPELPLNLLPAVEPACWDCPSAAWQILHDGARRSLASPDPVSPELTCYCLVLHMIVWELNRKPVMECNLRERALQEQQQRDEEAAVNFL